MLRELQKTFLGALRQPDGETADHLLMRGHTAKRPIAIYLESIQAQLIRSLSQIYPVTAQLVGDAFFEPMARHYISARPSRSPDLNDYGKDLAEFVEAFAPAQTLIYLPDVVRLEWAWHRAFNAPDVPDGNLSQLIGLDEAQLQEVVLYLHSTATLLHSPHPVHRIWEMNQSDAPEDMQVSLEEGDVHLIVWRRQLETRIDILSPEQFGFLQVVAAGTPLGRLTKMFSAPQLSTLLACTLERGYFECYTLVPNWAGDGKIRVPHSLYV